VVSLGSLNEVVRSRFTEARRFFRTMTDYDATAHISEEVKKASIAAPVAIFVAVLGTGIVGW
jgi:hypothetical protein